MDQENYNRNNRVVMETAFIYLKFNTIFKKFTLFLKSWCFVHCQYERLFVCSLRNCLALTLTVSNNDNRFSMILMVEGQFLNYSKTLV